MKRHGNLWDSLISFENLYAAYRLAIKHKRYTASASAFSLDLGENLLELRDELRSGSYEPGAYRTFTIYEPKQRLISAAPFRDRVVHHALCNVIEPIFERCFVFDSYATRVGKGTHAAVCRFSEFQKRFRYVLKLDVEKYFPSIDHEILKALVRRKIKCAPTLGLVDLVIDRSNEQENRELHFPGDELFTPFERRRGLPIGNLTSQFFANVYLDPIDHFVKEELHCRGYLRYMDDLCLFSDSKRELHQWHRAIEGRMAGLRLRLKASKSRVFDCRESIGFLGYRCLRTHRRLERGNVIRAFWRLRGLERRLAAREIEPAAYRASLMSWLGHAQWAATKGFILDCGICAE